MELMGAYLWIVLYTGSLLQSVNSYAFTGKPHLRTSWPALVSFCPLFLVPNLKKQAGRHSFSFSLSIDFVPFSSALTLTS